MALTNRERIVMILAGLAIALFIGDQYILEPVLNSRTEAGELKVRLEVELDQSRTLLARREKINEQWNRMQEAGLSSDIQKVEGLVLQFLQKSSAGSSFTLGSIQPERLTKEGQIGQLEFMVSGTGGIDAVTRFLWDIEMADIPIRIESMQLGSNDEDARQMNLQLKLSSIYLTDKSDKKEGQS